MPLIPVTEQTLQLYKTEIESGKMQIEFHVLSGNSFVTEFSIKDARTVLDAYAHLPDLRIESWLYDPDDPPIRDSGRLDDSQED